MLYQGNLSWTAGEKLTLTYDLKVTKACTVVAKIGDCNTNTLDLYGSNVSYLNPGVYLSNTLTVTAGNNTNGNGIVYIILGSNPTSTDMYIDNVTLTDGQAATPTPTPTPKATPTPTPKATPTPTPKATPTPTPKATPTPTPSGQHHWWIFSW
jgi:cell division septation protein DedD